MTLPDFSTFYAAIHERDPFRWQVRAAAELAERGWWPQLTAPTGAGKTTLIEAWLNALARSGPESLGRRLIWVVDRRAVIDQVFEHADYVLARVLADNAVPVLREVSDRLRALGGGEDPVCALWRGGLDEAAGRDVRQPLDPARVACICSTVDQVGSRLLFRGYGIAPGSRAIHAGLVGIDATIVLDEAHIAAEFLATVRRIGELQRSAQRSDLRPTRIVEVTATPPRDTDGFTLTASERAEPAIAARINARKWMRIAPRERPRDAAEEALKLAGGRPDRAVGIVLNTVGEARAAFDALAAAGVANADRTLVIGPVRPLDRAAVLERIPERAARGARSDPFFVVATQTIEVGLDLDLDALVTACAPVPALIQRLGRLDRIGDVRNTHAVVLPPPRRGCPVYGEETTKAHGWLQEQLAEGKLDMGPAAIDRLRPTARRWPEPDRRLAPVLLPFHVQALACTDASESEVPEVALYLHGDRDISPEVQLIWRSDIDAKSTPQDVADRLALRPPHAAETLTISLRAAMRWLSRAGEAAVADVPEEDRRQPLRDGEPPGGPRAAWSARPAARELGAVVLDARPVAPGGSDDRAVRPGDLLVVASSEGGADEYGWAPASAGAVQDLGSLDPERPGVVLTHKDGDDVARVREALEAGDLHPNDAAEQLACMVRATLPRGKGYDETSGKAAIALADGIVELVGEHELVVRARPVAARRRSVPGAVVTLAEHQRNVERRVDEIVDSVRLVGDIAAELKTAAAHHDEGKRDPRFQTWLAAGVPVPDPLAKSIHPSTPERRRNLREAAGWPPGKRHEIASALLVRQACPEAVLAGWLVATHHGVNRPFPHAVEDSADDLELVAEIKGERAVVAAADRLDFESHLSAFERLSAEHGHWGLAYLEAILVFADRDISGAGG